MVETAAKAGWDADTQEHGLSSAYGWREPGGDVLNDSYRAQARAMLDAILPQVTTVAELEALALGSIVVSYNGYPFERGLDDGMCLNGEYQGTVGQFGSFFPLTVVWQPA